MNGLMDDGTMEYDDTTVTQGDLNDLDGPIPLRDCVIVHLLTHFVEDARCSHPPIKAAILAPDVSNSVYLTVVSRQIVPLPRAELGPADLARPRIFGGDDYDYLLMPLHTPGHWMLAILDRKRWSVTFFDPLQPPDDVPHLRTTVTDLIKGVVAAVHGGDLLDLGMDIQVADYKSFTKQTDLYNCGVHVCLIAENFLKGRVDLRADNLDVLTPGRLTAERLRYRQLLCATRPNLSPSHGKGIFPRHAHSAQVPYELRDPTILASAVEGSYDVGDHVVAIGSVTEPTKRGKQRPNKRSPITKYFEQTAEGMKCPFCKGILTARNNQFNAANLEQHLAKHSESDEYKRFVAEKAEWRAREPQSSLIHINPLGNRKRRSPIANDAERTERKRVSTRAAVARTRERCKRLKMGFNGGGVQTCAEDFPDHEAITGRLTLGSGRLALTATDPLCSDERTTYAYAVQYTADGTPSQANSIVSVLHRNASYGTSFDQDLSRTCADLYGASNTRIEYATVVRTYPNPCSPFRIVDDDETRTTNYLIGTFERLYKTYRIDTRGTYSDGTPRIEYFDGSESEWTLQVSLLDFMIEEDGKRLDTETVLPLVGRPSDSEFSFLAAVLKKGTIWPLINSVKRRLMNNADNTCLIRLFGILGSVIVHVAAAEVFSLDVIDMTREAADIFFTDLDNYFTALKIYAGLPAIELLEQNTDDDTIREVFSMNEIIYHRRLFYNLCSERSPRISAALGPNFSLVPRQAAAECQLGICDAYVNTWANLTREKIWIQSLIPFNVDLEPIRTRGLVSIESLAFYAFIHCSLKFDQRTTSVEGTSVWAGINYRDLTSPPFDGIIRQLRARNLYCDGFSESALIFNKEIASVKWCVSRAHYISHVLIDFTLMEQLLACLTEFADNEFLFPRAMSAVSLECKPVELCNVTIRYRDQLRRFKIRYDLRSENIIHMAAVLRAVHSFVVYDTRDPPVFHHYDSIMQFMTELKSRASSRRNFHGKYNLRPKLIDENGVLHILFGDNYKDILHDGLFVKYRFKDAYFM